MNKQHLQAVKQKVEIDGFAIIPDVISNAELVRLKEILASVSDNNPLFRKQAAVFAIRRFLDQVPQAREHLFGQKMKEIITSVFGQDHFPVKSIYFDKPGSSNWFVSYHQDLTISVNTKAELPGFGPWTTKHDRFAVQPPLEILQNSYTVRIHLDDTDENNGALRIIPGSHQKGIYRPETIDWTDENEFVCKVPAGGIMIMKPLLLHASGRTVNDARRRVIHIEFCNQALPSPLEWAERLISPTTA